LQGDPLRVALDREVELAPVVLSVRDWPGLGGPLLHVRDPLRASNSAPELAATFAPEHRVLSVHLRPEVAYQVSADDLAGLVRQFGFSSLVVVAERLACLPAALLAAWHPERVASLVLISPSSTARCAEQPLLPSLQDCPPDWPRLRQRLRCSVLELEHLDLEAISALLGPPG
jgi:pimeloyl-ACP methyl ester carboxylesterase